MEQLDPQVQENWKLQRSVRKSLLGYTVLDLVEHGDKLEFGTWNPRPLKSMHIQRLRTLFEQNGLERFDEKSVIPLVIKKEALDTASLTLDLTDVNKIASLKFLGELSTIKCAGGRHCFEALKGYIEGVHQAFNEVEKKRDRIALLSDNLSQDDVQYFNTDSVKELQHLGGILRYSGKWLVAVYDESKWLFSMHSMQSYISSPAPLLADGIELAQYLSRNETKHVYMETDEERVIMEIQLLATLPEEKREQRLKELRSRGASKKANPLVTIVNSDSAFKATELLVNHSSYFLDMPEMNVKWLHSQLCGIHGGVSNIHYHS